MKKFAIAKFDAITGKLALDVRENDDDFNALKSYVLEPIQPEDMEKTLGMIEHCKDVSSLVECYYDWDVALDIREIL